MRVLDRREIRLQLGDLENRDAVCLEKQARRGQGHGWVRQQRSSGVHLSQVLKYVAVQTGSLKEGDEDFEEEFPLRMAIGMAWEEWAQGLWPELIWQPGEVEKDGVIGSPDGLTVDFELGDGRVVRVLEEFKFTWKSSRNRHASITGEWLWMRQMMGYCWMMGPEVRHARLHVLWSNGQWDWKVAGGFSPTYNTYLIEFDEQELERNWNMVQASKGKVEAEQH